MWLVTASVTLRHPLSSLPVNGLAVMCVHFPDVFSLYDTMPRLVHPSQTSYLGVDPAVIDGKQMCYANIVGFRIGSIATADVLEPLAACAAHQVCFELTVVSRQCGTYGVTNAPSNPRISLPQPRLGVRCHHHPTVTPFLPSCVLQQLVCFLVVWLGMH